MSEAKIVISAEDRAKAVLEGVKSRLGDVAEKGAALNEGFARLAPVLGAAFAGLSFTAFVKSTAQGIDALNDIKDATGASIENISALEDVALRTGTPIDTVTTSLVKLNQVLSAATPGSDKEQILQAIGLSAEALRQQDPAEALRQVAVALSSYADDGNKARVAQELFGKSLREVAPYLNDLAEKSQLVATVTSEQAAQAEQFNKQLAELSAKSTELARNLVSTLLPALNNLFDRVKQDGGFFAAFWQDIKVDFFAQQARNAVGELGRATAELQRIMQTPEDKQTLWQKARVRELRDDIAELQRDANRANSEVKRLLNGGKEPDGAPVASYSNEGRNKPKPSLTVPAAPTASPRRAAAEDTAAQTALAGYVRQLQAQIDKTVELTEEQKALNLLQELGTTGQIPQVRELVLGLAQKAQALRNEAELEKAITEELERQAKIQKALDDDLDRFSGRMEDARKAAQTARLEARIAAGEQFTTEELERIVKGIAGIKDEVKPEVDEMSEMFKQFARNVQDSLGDTIYRTLKGDFDNLGAMWGDLLLKMAAQAMAAKLGQSLFGDWFKPGGSLGGVVGDALSWFGLPGFASGGMHAGGLRIVGENGPELESTGPSRIFNAEQTRSMLSAGQGGMTSVTFAPVIQIDSRSDRAAVLADTQRVLAANNRELLQLLKDKRAA